MRLRSLVVSGNMAAAVARLRARKKQEQAMRTHLV
jgi:hypothetical protein